LLSCLLAPARNRASTRLWRHAARLEWARAYIRRALLDADTSGTVEYWFRNEPRKPWSIGIVMPSGDRYFPDFADQASTGRTTGDGLLLIETKGQSHPER
jgi:hypothetical protein